MGSTKPQKDAGKFNFVVIGLQLAAIVVIILSVILAINFLIDKKDLGEEIKLHDIPTPVIAKEIFEDVEIEDDFFISEEKDKQLSFSIVSVYAGDNLGGGFVVGELGYVLTNYDIVMDAKWIEVDFYDRTIGQARIRRYDESKNLALIQVVGRRANPLKLGDSSALSEGQEVAVFSHPSGCEISMSNAQVTNIYPENGTFDFIVEDLIFDRGCLGGPVIDLEGRVAGIIVQASGGKLASAVYSDGLKDILDGI